MPAPSVRRALTTRTIARVLSVIGIAISGYLTLSRFAGDAVPLACSTSGIINCEQVTTSAQSTIGPVPVVLLGLAWFLVMLGLTVAGGDRPPQALRALRLAWTTGGLFFVLYLVYAELFLIGAICLWCTAVHLLVFALFLLALNDVMAAEIADLDAVAADDGRR